MWSSDLARLEAKLDAAFTQAEADRPVTTAHIAECNLRNKRADDNEQNARNEWATFKADTFNEIKKLSDQVRSAQLRIAGIIAFTAGLAWAAEHFHFHFP